MVLSSEIEGNWDIVITSLQDICNSNESLSFDNIYNKYLEDFTNRLKDAKENGNDNDDNDDDNDIKRAKRTKIDKEEEEELNKLKEEIIDHKSNIGTAKRLIDTSQEKLQTLIEYLQKEQEKKAAASKEALAVLNDVKGSVSPEEDAENDTGADNMEIDEEEEEEEVEEEEEEVESKETSEPPVPVREGVSTRKGTAAKKRGATPSSAASSTTIATKSSKASAATNDSKITKDSKKGNVKKVGRSFYTSKFNPSEPILVGSEVAYKLKNRHFEEWIQCEVMKVIGDGIKFEIRDPEPDENNNPGQTFKANYKEVLLIPPIAEVKELSNYPYGTKVLARYPETTTFYPAIVVGSRKDGNVRLKFDGEEEVNKETEVERRLVVPFPEK
ncbi:SGF29 tudor-like domain-containing protein [Scheffersomyces coipomensis]|uniref:SGF29 tudor-like domain-containing protein n=1 Tax=Scheffersomyces coipomensis TaxID=1788519 RepID=UPI00315D283A